MVETAKIYTDSPASPERLPAAPVMARAEAIGFVDRAIATGGRATPIIMAMTGRAAQAGFDRRA